MSVTLGSELSPLLRVPLEIRELIYGQLLVGTYFFFCSEGGKHLILKPGVQRRELVLWEQQGNHRSCLPLLFACQQIFRELIGLTGQHVPHQVVGMFTGGYTPRWTPLDKLHLDNIRSIDLDNLWGDFDQDFLQALAGLPQLKVMNLKLVTWCVIAKYFPGQVHARKGCLAEKGGHAYLRELLKNNTSEVLHETYRDFFNERTQVLQSCLRSSNEARISISAMPFALLSRNNISAKVERSQGWEKACQMYAEGVRTQEYVELIMYGSPGAYRGVRHEFSDGFRSLLDETQNGNVICKCVTCDSRRIYGPTAALPFDQHV